MSGRRLPSIASVRSACRHGLSDSGAAAGKNWRQLNT
jgi:hypothetical protein